MMRFRTNSGNETVADPFTISMFGALFAVMNPFVNLPFFLSLTQNVSAAERRSLAIQVVIGCIVVCTITSVGGAAILGFFGITTDAFRIAGTLVLGQIGFVMLNGSESAAHHGTEGEKPGQSVGNIAFYPMTFPMLVGPGTITALIVNSHTAATNGHYLAFTLVIATVIAILAVVLIFSSTLGAMLTQTMRVIMTRIMGMIPIAISVEMFVAGLKALLPGLG